MATAFKVMTWNLENLFLPGEGGGTGEADAFDQKLANLARTILDLAPDVLAVQEVGSDAAFGALRAALGGRYPHARLSSLPDGRGIRVGFLSGLEIEAHEDFADFPAGPFGNVLGLGRFGTTEADTRMGRGALRARVRPTPDFPVDLVTAHLKSKLLSFPSVSGEVRFAPKDEDERAVVAGLALVRRAAEAGDAARPGERTAR